MLNGVDPIFLFNFYKSIPELEGLVMKIPLVPAIANRYGLPPIPVYLSERVSGVYIDAEAKNIDIETSVETLKDGEDPVVNQKGIQSITTITMEANKGSIGMTLLTALAERVFPKVTSKEYGITYLHGGVIVLNGLLHSFSVSQSANDSRFQIQIQLSNSTGKTKPPLTQPVVAKEVVETLG